MAIDLPMRQANAAYLTGIKALSPYFINICLYSYDIRSTGDAVMTVSDRQVYQGYPEPELIARAHLAARERERREREAAAVQQVLELEEIILHQPNDFAD
jgi:hypothetical protein